MTSTALEGVSSDNGDLMFASMGSSIESLEEQIRATRASQIELNEKIKEMAEFLHELNDHEEPYDIQLYVAKLQDSKRRLHNVSQVIGSVHDRLSRIQRMIAREIFKKKKMIKETKIPPLPEH
ncbi:hypothetical protein DICVIV_05974 [Dictyocaulus viviparus]|uniref:Biogenesis of lysosome-related organelles complex 1 subunit 7 n=1 Tax=Dictyocaulus viviparus TaxID=29172 RepID=A0A0D8XVZ5_DICVI|nr:hypothetical protein DICVIV_05974 [Dictyocaulus viviparus]